MLSRFSCVQLFVTPWTVACKAPLSTGILQARILELVAISISRVVNWYKIRQMDPSWCPKHLWETVWYGNESTGSEPPQDPMGSLALLNALSLCNVTSAVLCLAALQSSPTLCNTVDCSPPGSSVHRDSPGKNTGVGCHALLQGIFPMQGSNLHLLQCWQILYH